VAEADYKSIPANLGVKDRFRRALKKPPPGAVLRAKGKSGHARVHRLRGRRRRASSRRTRGVDARVGELPAVTAADKALAPGRRAASTPSFPETSPFDWVAGDEAATEAR